MSRTPYVLTRFPVKEAETTQTPKRTSRFQSTKLSNKEGESPVCSQQAERSCVSLAGRRTGVTSVRYVLSYLRAQRTSVVCDPRHGGEARRSSGLTPMEMTGRYAQGFLLGGGARGVDPYVFIWGMCVCALTGYLWVSGVLSLWGRCRAFLWLWLEDLGLSRWPCCCWWPRGALPGWETEIGNFSPKPGPLGHVPGRWKGLSQVPSRESPFHVSGSLGCGQQARLGSGLRAWGGKPHWMWQNQGCRLHRSEPNSKQPPVPVPVCFPCFSSPALSARAGGAFTNGLRMPL